ncbi:MAG: 50S ribosomal protein L23 [Patescibacteria group bacterium]|mgnify:CR=1 FL=1
MAFWKKDKKENKENKTKTTPAEFKDVGVGQEKEASSPNIDISKFRNIEAGVLKSFYISEKSTMLNSASQYVFKVFDNATKSEIKKQVEKGFDVKVKSVKTIILPRKSRTLGRHSGFKPGFKKAIVVLKKGYSIEQAKA